MKPRNRQAIRTGSFFEKPERDGVSVVPAHGDWSLTGRCKGLLVEAVEVVTNRYMPNVFPRKRENEGVLVVLPYRSRKPVTNGHTAQAYRVDLYVEASKLHRVRRERGRIFSNADQVLGHDHVSPRVVWDAGKLKNTHLRRKLEDRSLRSAVGNIVIPQSNPDTLSHEEPNRALLVKR